MLNIPNIERYVHISNRKPPIRNLTVILKEDGVELYFVLVTIQSKCLLKPTRYACLISISLFVVGISNGYCS